MPQPTSKARLVITALFVDHQSPAEVAIRYGVHRAWVSKLKARYEAEGEAAFEPRSRRPKTSPTALDPRLVDLIVRLRKELTDAGLDAGPETIAWHLEHHHGRHVARSTISRHLTRAGPGHPRAEEATQVLLHPVRSRDAEPDLAVRLHPLPAHRTRRHPGADVEIISWLDDCTRYALRVTAHPRVTGPIVTATFRETLTQHGIPASTLTDNGMVYTVRLAGGRGGRNTFETRTQTPARGPEELPPQPPHHLRQGRKIPADDEEVAARPTRPAQPPSRELQTLLDTFVDAYNHRRPHQLTAAPGHPRRPLRLRCPKPSPASPATPTPTTGSATTRVDKAGSVTLRHSGRLHHIGIGRTHAGTCVILLVQDLHIRVVNTITGELLRELTLNPTHRLPAHRRTQRTHPTRNEQHPDPKLQVRLSPMS